MELKVSGGSSYGELSEKEELRTVICLGQEVLCLEPFTFTCEKESRRRKEALERGDCSCVERFRKGKDYLKGRNLVGEQTGKVKN